jgi:tartrate dehydrogenase/decarboxylase/D-malate dehydrogenase
MILSGAMLLRHLGEARAAIAVERAVDAVLTAGAIRTADLGGVSSTMQVGEAVAAAVFGVGAEPGMTQ